MLKTLIRSLAWSSLCLAMAVVSGCADLGSSPTCSRGWQERANEVAAGRLAVTRGISEAGHDALAGSVSQIECFHLAADSDKLGEASLEKSSHEKSPKVTEPNDTGSGPLPGFFETVKRDLKQAPGVLWDDTKKVYGNPLNVLFLLGAGGASLALRPEVDDDIEDYYEDHHTFSEDWRDAFGVIGNPGTHFAMAGVWYLLGQQMQDVKTYQVGKQLFSVLTVTGVSTMLLKVSANTDSPNGEGLAWPSGHVSSTMAVATVLNRAYGPLVGVPMFGLTALAGVERLDDGEHHLSDVVFGAALGWVVAESIIKEQPPELFGGEVVPYIDPVGHNAGVAWVKTLGR